MREKAWYTPLMNLSIPISAMVNANRRQSVTANNVANLNTPGFQVQRADSVSLEQGGVTLGAITTDTTSASAGASNVDLTHEMIQSRLNVLDFQANANVLRVQDQLLAQGVDLLRDHS